MKPKVGVITLAVSDLERSLAFYRDGLGLPSQGIVGTEFEDGAVAFFELDDDFVLALYPKESLTKDARLPVSESGGSAAFALGHVVDSRQEVDAVMAEAKQAGATITDAAHERFWGGYSGYFQDPDGHLWEIVWMPLEEAKD